MQWDFDGTGTFPFRHEAVDGTKTEVTLTTTHTYEGPGPTSPPPWSRSHRDGDVDAKVRRLQNLASARVVVH